MGHCPDLGVAVTMIAAFSIMVGGAGRRWGVDAKLEEISRNSALVKIIP